MYRIFISHNSNDTKEAIAIKQWLTENGWNDVFLDIDTKDGLTPGERWKNALTNAVDRCEAVLCLISPTWLTSPECKLEYRFAETLRKHLFLALLKPCNLQDFSTDWQWCPLYGNGHQTIICIDFHGQSAECQFLSDGLARLKNGLIKSGISAEHFPWPPKKDPNRAPYRGLSPLEADDAAIFFGRNTQILHGMETIWDMRRSGIERLLVILGASGSGKSSFMRAGLLPRLTRDNRLFFPLPVIRPRNAVITGEDGLAVALFKAYTDLDRKITLGQIERELNTEPQAFHTLLVDLEHLLRERLTNEADDLPPSIVIAIDQAEELFNPDGAAEAAHFLNLLSGELAKKHSAGEPITQLETATRFIVMLTIRSDRYERLQTAPVMSGLKPRLFDLKPLPHSQFERVINGPAERVTQSGRKLIVDARLTDRLLADFSEGSDTLPLLGFTLEKLYRKYGSDGDLMLEEYEDIRGQYDTVQAAIFQEAIDTALKEPYRPPTIPTEQTEQYQGLRRTFIPFLVRINPENNEPLRQMAKLGDIPTDVYPFIDRLVNARLLVRDKNDTVEVAHESLFRQWQKLSEWLKKDMDQLRLQENIRYSAAEWRKDGQRDDLLVHRNGRLKEALALLATQGYKVSDESDERVYLDACTAAQQARETAEKLEQERRIHDAERIAEEQKNAAIAAEKARTLEETARVQAERFAKRSRKQKWFAVIVAFFALYASYAANRSANEATKQLITTEAAILWHPLDFSSSPVKIGQSKGLLQLAQSDEVRKYAFFEQLLQDETLAERFSHQPRLIITAAAGLNLEQRNLFLDHLYKVAPENEANKVFRVARMWALLELEGKITPEGITDAIQATDDPIKLEVLGQFMAMLPLKLTEAQAGTVIDKYVSAIQQATDNSQDMLALGRGIALLPFKLTEEQASVIANKFVGKFKITGNYYLYDHEAIAQMIMGLPVKFTETQAGMVVDNLIGQIRDINFPFFRKNYGRSMAIVTTKLTETNAGAATDKFVNAIQTTDNPVQLETLSRGLAVLPVKLTETQVSAVINRLMSAIQTTDDPFQLEILGQSVAALPFKLTDTQATAVIDKYVIMILSKRSYGYLGEDALAALTRSLAILSIKLTETQANAVIDKFMSVIQSTTFEFELINLGLIVTGLPLKLTETQANAVIDKFMSEIQFSSYISNRNLTDLSQILTRLPIKLTETQIEAMTDKFVKSIEATNDPSELFYFYRGGTLLPFKLDEKQSSMVTEKFVNAIQVTHIPSQLETLLRGMAALNIKLTDTQSGVVTDKIMKLIQATNDSDQLISLGQGVAVFPVKLNGTQIDTMVAKFVGAFQAAHYPSELVSLGWSIALLPIKLTETQVVMVADKLINLFRSEDYPYSSELPQVVAVLATKLTETHARAMVYKFIDAMVVITGEDQLKFLGRSVAILAGYINHNDTAATLLFEALKNPLIPREIVIDAIYKCFPDAPSIEKGFWSLIEWAEKRFPHLNLKMPLQKSTKSNFSTPQSISPTLMIH